MRKNMRNYAKICESHNFPPPAGCAISKATAQAMVSTRYTCCTRKATRNLRYRSPLQHNHAVWNHQCNSLWW